jgi:hypothetical protein
MRYGTEASVILLRELQARVEQFRA